MTVQSTVQSNDKLRIAIVDDHPLFREGVAATLNNDQALEVKSRDTFSVVESALVLHA